MSPREVKKAVSKLKTGSGKSHKIFIATGDLEADAKRPLIEIRAIQEKELHELLDSAEKVQRLMCREFLEVGVGTLSVAGLMLGVKCTIYLKGKNAESRETFLKACSQVWDILEPPERRKGPEGFAR